jgi:hypothetical protein
MSTKTKTIAFDEAIRKAHALSRNLNKTSNVLVMIVAQLTHSDNKRVWEFRYKKMQYEELGGKVIEQDPLAICWKNIRKGLIVD